MPALDYCRARAELRLANVLELIGYEPCSRHGQQWRGPCPLHGSRSATSRSFAAHLGKNLFHCFRCGAGGNALDLWSALSRGPLHAAVLDLCQRLHQEVPWLNHPKPTRRRGNARANKSHPETQLMPAP
jgi:DNA primase